MTVSGLRMGAKLWDASVDEMPRMTSHSRWLLNAAADQIERLTEALEVAKVGFEQIEPASTVTDTEIKRAALAKITWALTASERKEGGT